MLRLLDWYPQARPKKNRSMAIIRNMDRYMGLTTPVPGCPFKLVTVGFPVHAKFVPPCPARVKSGFPLRSSEKLYAYNGPPVGQKYRYPPSPG